MNIKLSLIESYYYILGRIVSQSEIPSLYTTQDDAPAESAFMAEPRFGVFAHGGVQTAAELMPWSVPLLANSGKSTVEGRFFGSATLIDNGYVLFTRHQLKRIKDDPELKDDFTLGIELGTSTKTRDAPQIHIEEYGPVRGHDLMAGKLAELVSFEQGCIGYEFPDTEPEALLPNSNAMGLFCGWGSNVSGHKYPPRTKNDVVLPLDKCALPPCVRKDWEESWKSTYKNGFTGNWEDTHLWTCHPHFSPAPGDSGGALVIMNGRRIVVVGVAIKHPSDISSSKIGLYLNVANLKAEILAVCRRLG